MCGQKVAHRKATVAKEGTVRYAVPKSSDGFVFGLPVAYARNILM